MTNQQHPIVPPPDRIHNWLQLEKIGYTIEQIITVAAQYGADLELEACCEEMKSIPSPLGIPFGNMASNALRAARRPNPPSLREQALALIDGCNDPDNDCLDDDALATIRRALETLPE
jgi:hypothetical protein